MRIVRGAIQSGEKRGIDHESIVELEFLQCAANKNVKDEDSTHIHTIFPNWFHLPRFVVIFCW